ncbi:unnamed protein product [Microthlaspi erraticum]|uniref:Sucrose transporter n=1 Tax=Microthlaspi erraticum TaxID=1685480 RepID=A0A6D2JUB5_9BRAS|nr:unnamed protein product [Microthlaspi erraticum]
MSNLKAETAAKDVAVLETKSSIVPADFGEPSPLKKIISMASIAAGVQFGWALQLSLLTPYPTVGYYSDRCTSRFGRRRPFIAVGAILVAVAGILIGYAADLGRLAGDNLEKTPKVRAIWFFALGFWILDVANNTLQGPCRAFLADLSAGDAKKTRTANAIFSFFMAVGNILGYAAGSYTNLHKMFPFTMTEACDIYCANLKSCFFLSIILLLAVTVTSLFYVKDKQWSPEKGASDVETPFFGEIFGAFRVMERPMWMLIIVTALNWIAWFPFLLFDTDWMGREVYGGDSSGDDKMKDLYNKGVHKMGGAKRLWGVVNFILAVCLGLTVLITKLAEAHRKTAGAFAGPTDAIRGGALTIFAFLGIPLAITFSIPFALASIISSNSGAGQGLSLGVLNLAIVIPQMVVSLGGGPFDALFGGGNLPGFVVGAIAAAVSGVVALTVLP